MNMCSAVSQPVFPRFSLIALFLVLFLVLSILPKSSEQVLASEGGDLATIAVVGVTNETGDEQFSDLLIVDGIANLVAQEFYDTGQYIPVEDKAEIRERIAKLRANSVSAGGSPLAGADVAGELGSDAVASVTIKKLKKSRFRGFAGIFGGAKTTITLIVEVALQKGDHPLRTATGEGKGTTKAVGAFFQIREDKVHFDETTVGRAVQQAIHQAVSQLI